LGDFSAPSGLAKETDEMNLRQIEAFKAVMESGTVTQAALRMHVSQPAVSKLLQMFERSSGMQLFTRDRGRLAPTSEALLLYDEVERVFQGAEQVRKAAEEIRSLQRGTLSVGVMPALAAGFAQEVLARLESSQPKMSVNLQARETVRLTEQLVMRQIELFCTFAPLEHPELTSEVLCRVPLVCILPLGHRLAKRSEISCRDLRDERCASLTHNSPIRRRVDQAFEEAKVTPSYAFESTMATAICSFVARGLGVAIVNPVYVGTFSSSLVAKPFVSRIETDLMLVLPRGRRISKLGEAFAEAARAVGAEFSSLSKR
jgi:DNA-binding transcriptional LysR family regulator